MQDNESQLQSPFADRLHTNYIPFDPEVEQIHRVISKSLAEISRLDEKILHLQSMIDPLLRERKKISSYVDAHRALLSGMRRLPSELLQEIFLYCISNRRRYVDPDVLINCAEAPLLLGHVCSSWRRTAMSTPQLWSLLHFPLHYDMFGEGRHDRFRLQQRVAALQLWLKLSASCPLYISFNYTSDIVEVDQAMNLAAISLFQALVPFSHRWKEIACHIPLCLFDAFFATFTEDVPLLKSISLTPTSTTTEHERVTTWYSIPIFQVPSLRSLSVHNMNISVVPNWNHLEQLDLVDLRSNLTTSKALETLSRCTNLICCRMAGVCGVNAAPASTISLPSLRLLNITEGMGRPSDLKGFFDALEVPSLQIFTYEEGYKLASEMGISCKSIMSQPHSPGIESIDLPRMPPSRIAEYLAFLPFLKQLSIRRGTIDEYRLDDCDLLTLLTPSSDSGKCLSPHLEEIEFKDCIAITEDALCAFVTARTSHPEVARLKNARFSFLRPKTRDILPELESLNGLYLDITYSE